MTDKFGLFNGWGPFGKKYAGLSRIEKHAEVDGVRSRNPRL